MKAFEESDIAKEMMVDKTRNIIGSVDQGAIGAMTTDYVQELVSDDEK